MDKENILCPGETIKELLETYHYTQQDLADKLNMDLKTVNEILNGKAVITVETAMKLEMIFNIDAIFWNNLEFNYRKTLKQKEQKEILEKEYAKIKQIYKEMVIRNLVEDTKDKQKIVDNFKKFMGITTVESLEHEYYKVACRKANTKNFDIINLMVWIQIGLKKAREIEIPTYNREKILSKIDDIRKLTLMPNQAKAREELINICNQCGIIVNFEKSMPRTAIYGIARWLNSTTPFIQISDRGKNISTFWFSFMHELGHIIKGRKKMCFIDMDGYTIENDIDAQILRETEEYKADKFARDSLINEKEYKNFLKSIDTSKIEKKDIINFSEKIGINPCILAGRLKFDNNKYNDIILNSFNMKLEF